MMTAESRHQCGQHVRRLVRRQPAPRAKPRQRRLDRVVQGVTGRTEYPPRDVPEIAAETLDMQFADKILSDSFGIFIMAPGEPGHAQTIERIDTHPAITQWFQYTGKGVGSRRKCTGRCIAGHTDRAQRAVIEPDAPSTGKAVGDIGRASGHARKKAVMKRDAERDREFGRRCPARSNLWKVRQFHAGDGARCIRAQRGHEQCGKPIFHHWSSIRLPSDAFKPSYLVPAPHRPYNRTMGRHRHQEFSGTSLRDAAKSALEEHGEQWTEMRAAIFDALAEHARPTSAYDIADAVSKARGKRVAPNSVYRILDLFVTSNLAIRVESSNAYLVNAHPGCMHDCMFLVCMSCGRAIHVDDDHLTSSVRARATAEGFTVLRPVIEVQGRCAECNTAI